MGASVHPCYGRPERRRPRLLVPAGSQPLRLCRQPIHRDGGANPSRLRAYVRRVSEPELKHQDAGEDRERNRHGQDEEHERHEHRDLLLARRLEQ
jgi:hypothetical protein